MNELPIDLQIGFIKCQMETECVYVDVDTIVAISDRKNWAVVKTYSTQYLVNSSAENLMEQMKIAKKEKDYALFR